MACSLLILTLKSGFLRGESKKVQYAESLLECNIRINARGTVDPKKEFHAQKIPF